MEDYVIKSLRTNKEFLNHELFEMWKSIPDDPSSPSKYPFRLNIVEVSGDTVRYEKISYNTKTQKETMFGLGFASLKDIAKFYMKKVDEARKYEKLAKLDAIITNKKVTNNGGIKRKN